MPATSQESVQYVWCMHLINAELGKERIYEPSLTNGLNKLPAVKEKWAWMDVENTGTVYRL